MFITFQHDICIQLLGFFSANCTWKVPLLVKRDDLSKPHTFSRPGWWVMQSCRQWPFQFKSMCLVRAMLDSSFSSSLRVLCLLLRQNYNLTSSGWRQSWMQTPVSRLLSSCLIQLLLMIFFFFCCCNKTLFSVFSNGTSYSSSRAANQKLGLTSLNKELTCKPYFSSACLELVF